MAFKLSSPEFRSQLRRREVQKLRTSITFDRVIRREVVDPTYRYEFDTLDDVVKVTKSSTGQSGAKSVVGIDRSGVNMNFYMAEMDFPWVDDWMQSQRSGSTLPTVPNAGGRLINPARAASLMLGDILREMEADYATQLVAQDASPTSIGADTVDTPEGRLAFIQTLLTVMGESQDALAQGEKVLWVDDKAWLHLAALPFAYTDGTGTATGSGPTTADMLAKVNVRVVPTQSSVLNGKAVLHYADEDAVSFLHSTPQGVEVLFGQQGDNKVLRVFHHAGFVAYRANASALHTQVLTGLI